MRKQSDYFKKILAAVLACILFAVTVIPGGGHAAAAEADNDIPVPEFTSSYISGYEEIKLTWEGVSGISGYLIYRSTEEDSGYSIIARPWATSESFVDRNVSIGETYYYKIKAYVREDDGIIYGAFSQPEVQKSMLNSPKNVKIQNNSYSSLKITWNKVKGAQGYSLYRSTDGGETYARLDTVGSDRNSYINIGLETGKKYYYRIAAVSGSEKEPGLMSQSVGAAPELGRATFNVGKITRYFNSIDLRWNSVKGATGYEILRSTSYNGTYTVRKTITSGSTLSWKDTGLVSSKNYYYKVRAVRSQDGRKITGDSSGYYRKYPYGWKYKNGYKLYYGTDGKLDTDLRSRVGKQSSYVIKVNKKRNVVTVYAKDGSNGYIIPLKSFICSSGKDTPVGTFYTPVKYRWWELMGPSWGQWNTRIYQGFLFHSVYYLKPYDNKSLPVNTYNRLGSTESHGCVRMRAGDAKWIYDNCKLGTKVIIYNSSVAGPYGKPSLAKLPYWHTWDPTDPTAYKYCAQHGCHGK